MKWEVFAGVPQTATVVAAPGHDPRRFVVGGAR
jgi:hypothetical protein